MSPDTIATAARASRFGVWPKYEQYLFANNIILLRGFENFILVMQNVSAGHVTLPRASCASESAGRSSPRDGAVQLSAKDSWHVEHFTANVILDSAELCFIRVFKQ
jgi:hypothetical protein